MALIVEDGSGKADSEAYISVADADIYFSNRGNTAWAALATPAKEIALRLGCDYIEAVYGPRFYGEKASTAQALSWPRIGFDNYESDQIPMAIERANCEMALRSTSGALIADEGAQVKQETVGPISVTYADGARQGVRYAAVDALLEGAGLLGSSSMIPVSRA